MAPEIKANVEEFNPGFTPDNKYVVILELHTGQMLNGAGDTDGKIHIGTNGLSGL